MTVQGPVRKLQPDGMSHGGVALWRPVSGVIQGRIRVPTRGPGRPLPLVGTLRRFANPPLE